MALLPIKLKAIEQTPAAQLEEFVNLMNTLPIPKFTLDSEMSIGDENPCIHCPKHLQLTNKINKALEEMAKDPNNSNGPELPAKLNTLKFLYYEEASHDQSGKLNCKRFMDFTPNLKPTKFEGQ